MQDLTDPVRKARVEVQGLVEEIEQRRTSRTFEDAA